MFVTNRKVHCCEENLDAFKVELIETDLDIIQKYAIENNWKPVLVKYSGLEST